MKFYPICDKCVAGEGEGCNEPTCSYCRSPVPPKMPWPEYGFERAQPSNAKYTPGPWCLEDGHEFYDESINNDVDFFTVVADSKTSNPPGIVEIATFCSGGGITSAEASANARLVIAAPELLTALQHLCAHLAANCEWEGYPENEMKAARAAISKAKGNKSRTRK